MYAAIVNCRLEKIKKLNIVTSITCANVVKNFSGNKMLKRLVEFSKRFLVAAVMFLFSLSDKPSANIIAAVITKLNSIDKKLI